MIYGQTQKQQDESLCRNKNRFNLNWLGRGNISTTGSVILRLKRENGSQAFYIPEQTYMMLHLKAVVSNATDAYADTSSAAGDTLEHIVSTYVAYRDLSGNVVIGIDPVSPQAEALCSVVPTANTTVQGFEIVVTALDAGVTSVLVFVEMECYCIQEGAALVNFPAGAADALTVAG